MWVDPKTGRSARSTPRPDISASCPAPTEDQSQRDGSACRTTRSTPTSRCCPTATSGGKARPTSRRRSASTGRARSGRRIAAGKAAHPNSRFTAPMTNNPGARPGRRTTPTACRVTRDHLRRPAQQDDPAGLPGVQLDARRVPRRDARLRDHRRRHRRRSASSAAIRWRCSRSLATTSAITSSTGSACASKMSDCPRIFHVNWFRTGRRTANSSGRASARTCAC